MLSKRYYQTTALIICGTLSVAVLTSYFYKQFLPQALYDPEAEHRYQYDVSDTPVIKGSTIIITAPVKEVQTRAPHSGRTARIPTMIYHSVRPYIPGESAEQDRYDVTPELFEQELKYLANNGYTTISYADVLRYFEHGTPLPDKPVILSFDDGWKNQFTYAFPLLQKYHMRGTFFIFSGAIGSRASFMSWEDIGTLHTAQMEIQGHSYSHPKLTQVFDEKVLHRELILSKQILEAHIHEPVTVFAYPFGMYDERIQEAVRNAGYHIARTTRNKSQQSSEHALTLGGTLSSDSFEDFRKVIVGE